MTDDIARLSAGELIAGYRDGSLSPVEATRAALARIEKHDPALNAFGMVDADPEGAGDNGDQATPTCGRTEAFRAHPPMNRPGRVTKTVYNS